MSSGCGFCSCAITVEKIELGELLVGVSQIGIGRHQQQNVGLLIGRTADEQRAALDAAAGLQPDAVHAARQALRQVELDVEAPIAVHHVVFVELHRGVVIGSLDEGIAAAIPSISGHAAFSAVEKSASRRRTDAGDRLCPEIAAEIPAIVREDVAIAQPLDRRIVQRSKHHRRLVDLAIIRPDRRADGIQPRCRQRQTCRDRRNGAGTGGAVVPLGKQPADAT